MVSDWSNSAYTQCRRDRAAQAQVIVDHGQRIAALEAELAYTKRHLELTEGSYNSDMRNAIAEHDKLEAENRALRESRPIVVVMDRNPDYSDQLAVYVDGKRVDAKVVTYHSEEDPGEILGRYIRVYRNEYGTPEDWELELPNAWKADEWAAILASEETYLPHMVLAADHGLPLPGAGEGGA